ncbi:MAG TPA: hypothetical protein VK889_01420 [Solirubrobacterales bacterium]|nr:hypothetical protein [Solirubrobacterales bacterium]
MLLLALSVPSPASAAFGLQAGSAGFDASVTEQNGSPTGPAGSHPFVLSLHAGFSGGDVRHLRLELPAGLIENPRAVPQCVQAEFAAGCSEASQVGMLTLRSGGAGRAFPLFNLTPAPGRPSQLGARPFGAPLTLTPTIRQGSGEYGITLTASNVTQVVAIEALDLTVWGNPWATAHDGQRGSCLNPVDPDAPLGQCPIDTEAVGQLPRAYLTMPTDCGMPLRFGVAASAWDSAGAPTATVQRQTPSDCASLPFSFGAAAVPSTAVASSPTGLTMRLTSSQAGLTSPAQRFASQPRRAVATLAEGITINPSVGAGLGACTPAQFAAESAASAPGEGCPNPSKIGVGSVETPLVDEILDGALFIATPFDNPYGAPYALYFVAKAPQRGFVVKVAGKLDADPLSGRLVATFDGLPQLPYSNLRLEFREGQRAPLVSPAACGSYANRIALQPWANTTAPPPEATAFPIMRGAGGGPCISGGAPFVPQAAAGSLNARAGAHSTFYLHLTRTDAEQEITSYSAQLPPGLLGAIAGVPFCSDAAIEDAKRRSGNAELNAPSCRAASQIGRTYSGYGAGLAPAYTAGRFYLAGPYHGAPLSVVAINPALVGPFDLGTVVIRSAIQVDPRSAQVTIDSSASDPIPHIFSGIPLRLRDVRVYIDRPGFMVNPTDCSRFEIVSTLSGSDVPFTDPRDVLATAAVPFQASDCSSLGFAPRVALALKGKPKRGGYQQLRVTVTPRAGDANISSAAVTLPPSIFLAQNHIRAICTRGQSATDSCPGPSVIGRAEALTPLLSDPLKGPVYLRSSDNPLPDLVTVLHGPGGIRIFLECRIDSFRRGMRGSCENLPDAPVTKFTMTIHGGRKRGILQSAENLCRTPRKGIAKLIGQANLGQASKPGLTVRCPKRKSKKKRSVRHRSQRRPG